MTYNFADLANNSPSSGTPGTVVAENTVDSTSIKDGSVQEVDLDDSVREKLNAAEGKLSSDDVGFIGEDEAVSIVHNAIAKAEGKSD